MPGFKRKIFYLSGFDPRGPRFYHQLYEEQAALYGVRAGREIVVGKRRRQPPHSARWTIEDKTADTITDNVFLGWDDVVRDHWVKNPIALLWRSIVAYYNFTTRVDWTHVITFPRGVRFAFYYPGVSAVLLPILFGLLLWYPAIALLGWTWGAVAALAIAVAVSMFIVRKIQGFWLLRFIIFNDTLADDRLDPAIETRMDEFVEAIRASFDEDWDEILFVTHSNGSIMGIPMMARLIETCGSNLPDHFAFVTLGSCIPLIGCRKDSHRFGALLDTVGQGDFLWLDIGSITDGACIAGIDPCVATPRPRRANLFQTSPRWFKYCDPATYDARRRNKYEVHFDYLRTFDRLSPLDYIAISSGDRPLRASIEAFKAENG